MNLSVAKNEILLRLGEGFDQYDSRANVHFINAISQLIKTDNYDESDIFQCVESIDIAIDSKREFIVIQNDILKILDFVNPQSNDSFTLNLISLNKFNFILDSDTPPDEIYIAQFGRNISLYKNSSDAVSFQIRYIYIPSYDYWQSNQDLSAFSNRFLFDCIDLAVKTLNAEIKNND